MAFLALRGVLSSQEPRASLPSLRRCTDATGADPTAGMEGEGSLLVICPPPSLAVAAKHRALAHERWVPRVSSLLCSKLRGGGQSLSSGGREAVVSGRAALAQVTERLHGPGRLLHP